jgi:predicted signal transduction protein with EAL and GGDEF domain
MSTTVYLLTICLPLATVLLVFGMKYFAMVQQAKARTARDEADRRLADELARIQAETVTQLTAMNAALARLDARMGAVEKVLKEVG